MNRPVGERERRNMDRGGWEAMRALGLNLNHWKDDHPVAAIVLGVALATGLFFVLLAITRGCENETLGGCGVHRDAPKIILGPRCPGEPCVLTGALPRAGRTMASRCKSGQSPIYLASSLKPQACRAAVAPAPGGRLFRRMRVTAYCPSEECCGPFADGITASLSRADHPLVAAPRDLAFGTRLRVPNYAVGWDVKVEDRGSAIRGDRLDVLFLNYDEAVLWGVQWLDVEIETEKSGGVSGSVRGASFVPTDAREGNPPDTPL